MDANTTYSAKQALVFWNNDQSESHQAFMERVIQRRYVPMSMKVYLAKLGHDKACQITDDDGKVIGYQPNSAQLYFSNICALITAYTNIDMSTEDSTMVSYDILQEAGIIEAILGYLKDDVPEWTRIWKLVGDDFYEEHFTTRGFLEKMVRKITHWVVGFKKKASETLSEVMEDPKLKENLEALKELYGASKRNDEE
nr:MAG TPA: hypothetical protein [Caudoviricetes sp.]